jgi:hypothetical protein
MYDRFPPHRLLAASGAQDPLTTTSRPPRVYRMPDLTVLSRLGLLACAELWWAGPSLGYAGLSPTRHRPPNTGGQRDSLTSILSSAPSHPAG